MIRVRETKEIVSINHKYARTPKESAKGLLGYNKPSTLIFKSRFGIHTLGMRFPIDVIVLDRSLKIIKLKSGLKPWRIYFWNGNYSVVEMKAGTIKKKRIKKGDKLEIL